MTDNVKRPPAYLDLEDHIEEKARGDAGYAIAHALLKLARAQESLADHVKYLGNGDAVGSMGAIEAFGLRIGEKLDALTGAVRRDDDCMSR
jgi:hypothetical protein